MCATKSCNALNQTGEIKHQPALKHINIDCDNMLKFGDISSNRVCDKSDFIIRLNIYIIIEMVSQVWTREFCPDSISISLNWISRHLVSCAIFLIPSQSRSPIISIIYCSERTIHIACLECVRTHFIIVTILAIGSRISTYRHPFVHWICGVCLHFHFLCCIHNWIHFGNGIPGVQDALEIAREREQLEAA